MVRRAKKLPPPCRSSGVQGVANGRIALAISLSEELTSCGEIVELLHWQFAGREPGTNAAGLGVKELAPFEREPRALCGRPKIRVLRRTETKKNYGSRLRPCKFVSYRQSIFSTPRWRAAWGPSRFKKEWIQNQLSINYFFLNSLLNSIANYPYKKSTSKRKKTILPINVVNEGGSHGARVYAIKRSD